MKTRDWGAEVATKDLAVKATDDLRYGGDLPPYQKGSRAMKPNRANGGKMLNQRRVTNLETEYDLNDGSQGDGDIEGINAFNTEDVLKQDVNPTNPVVLGADTKRENLDLDNLDSSRQLVDQKQQSYEYRTPGQKNANMYAKVVNEFTGVDKDYNNDPIDHGSNAMRTTNGFDSKFKGGLAHKDNMPTPKDIEMENLGASNGDISGEGSCRSKRSRKKPRRYNNKNVKENAVPQGSDSRLSENSNNNKMYSNG